MSIFSTLTLSPPVSQNRIARLDRARVVQRDGFGAPAIAHQRDDFLAKVAPAGQRAVDLLHIFRIAEVSFAHHGQMMVVDPALLEELLVQFFGFRRRADACDRREGHLGNQVLRAHLVNVGNDRKRMPEYIPGQVAQLNRVAHADCAQQQGPQQD